MLVISVVSAIGVYTFLRSPSADSEGEIHRQEIIATHRAILRNMPPEARRLMEMERKMHVKAYRKAFDSLTPEEKEQYKEVRAKIKENSDAKKEFFESLPPEEQKILMSPPGKENVYWSQADQSAQDKFREFARKNYELEKQIPEKIQNIELDAADKEELMKQRAVVEAKMAGGDSGAPR